MEFWGVEVKPGVSVKVDELELYHAYIHISQVALGEAAKKEKANEPVVIYLKVGEQKLVLGTLNREEIPQIPLDLVLDSEAELSHTSKNASVYFCGYRVDDCGTSDGGSFASSDSDDFSESDDDDGALTLRDNGKPLTKAEKEKVTESKKASIGALTKKVKIADQKKEEEDESDDESDDDDETDDEDESGSPDEMDADTDSDEEESDEEEETPVKKVDQGKKRPNGSASKTPVPAKRAKNVTPEKTDGKKNAHTSTPHPMKKGGKTPNSAAKNQHKKSKHGGH